MTNNDPAGYYNFLGSKGYLYGDLALGVVEDNTFSGVTARNYAEQVTAEITGQTISEAKWDQISLDLMRADFDARGDLFDQNSSQSLKLDYREIQSYHNSVFVKHGLHEDAWTANIVLNVSDDPAASWENMLNEGAVPFDNYDVFLSELRQEIDAEHAAHGYSFQGKSTNWMLQNMPATWQAATLLSPGMMSSVAADWGSNNSYGFIVGLSNFVQETAGRFSDFISDLIDTAVLHAGQAALSVSKKWFSDNTVSTPWTINDAGGGWSLGPGVSESEFNDLTNKMIYIGGQCHNIVSRIENGANIFVEQDQSGSYFVVVWDGAEGYEASDGTTVLTETAMEAGDAILNIAGEFFLAVYDPLVLDLDGDGLKTTSFDESSANFDLFTEKGLSANHGWVSPDDGLLAIDTNGDGKINDISELFGDRNTSGFTELAALDSNGDGTINADDEQFSSLLVWQDLNGDGVSQSEELESLSEHGIASLSLTSEVSSEIDNGNVISEVSTFTREDGSSSTLGDVHFAVDMSTLITNQSEDVFTFNTGTGHHNLNTFEDGIDIIEVAGTTFDDLKFVELAERNAVSVLGDSLEIEIANLSIEQLSQDDFAFV